MFWTAAPQGQALMSSSLEIHSPDFLWFFLFAPLLAALGVTLFRIVRATVTELPDLWKAPAAERSRAPKKHGARDLIGHPMPEFQPR